MPDPREITALLDPERPHGAADGYVGAHWHYAQAAARETVIVTPERLIINTSAPSTIEMSGNRFIYDDPPRCAADGYRLARLHFGRAIWQDRSPE